MLRKLRYTNARLIGIQLSDLAFQRHILVQALILIDFLLSLTEKAKKKLADANLTITNKAVVFAYVLDEEKVCDSNTDSTSLT